MKGFVTLVCFFLAVVAARCQPVITSQPQSLTVNVGSAVRFTVIAADTNTNSITYQWQFNGAKLSDGGEISGSSTTTLTVSPAALSDTGTYTVVVSSTDGSITNQTPAILTVQQGTIVNFQISGFTTGPSNLVVELFDHDKPATVENFIHY